MDDVCKQFGFGATYQEHWSHASMWGVWSLETLILKCKLSLPDKTEIQSILDDVAYTCGATLQDLDLPEKILYVYIREHSCFDPIEILYYSAGYAPICIYCAEEEDVEDNEDYYPLCSSCLSVKEKIYKRKSWLLLLFCVCVLCVWWDYLPYAFLRCFSISWDFFLQYNE